MPHLTLPSLEIRPYQLDAWKAFESGARRIVTVWPRRAGKDTMALQMLCYEAHRNKGNYLHVLPTATQARRALWNGINKDGVRHIDVAFPKELRDRTLDNEMLIDLKVGSTIQFMGSDQPDRLVGTNYKGVAFSEYALSNPQSYELLRPVLAENDGFAVFPSTPRGMNHYYDLYQKADADPNSFAQILTCDDTGHISKEALDAERAEMSEGLFQQEFYCSFMHGAEGSVYATYINEARADGRVAKVPYDSSLPVYAAFDLGLGDATAIWAFQVGKGGQPRWLNYMEDRGRQVAHYDKWLRDLNYPVRRLFMPHDGDHHRLGMATSVIDQFRQQGWDATMLPLERSLAPGIERCRVAIGKSLFDENGTSGGLAALSGYAYTYDDKRQVFSDKPNHNWASDGSDAYRYAVQAIHLGLIDQANHWKPLDYSEQDKGLRYG